MDKSLFIYILIGIGFFYVVTDFVGGIQKEDEAYQNSGYQQEHKYDQYYGIDSVGQTVLKLTGVDDAMQAEVWNMSELKKEWLTFFPDFSQMKLFVRGRIEGGDVLKKKLLSQISEAESKFFAGSMSLEQAKHMLDSSK